MILYINVILSNLLSIFISFNKQSMANSTAHSNNPSPAAPKLIPLLSSLLIIPLLAVTLVYQLDRFDPVPMPIHELAQNPLSAPLRNDRMLRGVEYITGAGNLKAPEDIAYDRESGLIYTGCADGWIKRVTVNESVSDTVVENWVNTGGRPLGLVFGLNNELIVADADKGLLRVSKDGGVELLSDEADGLKFKLTDGVDVAKNGIIYFTDASYKYNLKHNFFDIFEGNPHGRLLSYDPITKQTKVLVNNLYFANGVAISPDQNFVIFCETTMRRCKKYYIEGDKKGLVENFVKDLPGLPDNIMYDGEGLYWIAFPTGVSSWNLLSKYPMLRKIGAIMEKYNWRPNMDEDSGVIAIDLEGKPVAHYYDNKLPLVTSAIKIGNFLYCGSIVYPHILRLNLHQHPARPITAA